MPDGTGNQIRNVQLIDDSLVFRMFSINTSPILKTRVATMPAHDFRLGTNVFLPEVEGGNSMVKDSQFYLLPSQDADDLQQITLNRLDENFAFVDSVHLKFANDSFYHFVGPAMAYNGKYIVTGSAQNAFGFPYSRAVIFILNKDLTLYDTLVFQPVRQAIHPVDMAVNPVDGLLYVSFKYDNFLQNDSTFVPAPRYQRVVKLNTSFQRIDYWSSEDEVGHLSACPITFSESGTMYTAYQPTGGFDYVAAVDPLGQVRWKTPLDSFWIIESTSTVVWLTSRAYDVRDVVIASNGDLLVAGSVEYHQYNVGYSSLLVRLRPNGEIKWTKVIRSNNRYNVLDWGYRSLLSSLVELPNGDLVAGGLVERYDAVLAPNDPPRIEAWVVHADSNGCISPECGYLQDVVQKTTYFPIVSPVNEWTVQLMNLARRLQPDGNTGFRPIRFGSATVIITNLNTWIISTARTAPTSFSGRKTAKCTSLTAPNCTIWISGPGIPCRLLSLNRAQEPLRL